MHIIYPAFIRIPTEKAHGIQIMKMCEAFTAAGHTVELVVPVRPNALVGEDPFVYVGIRERFTITYLPVLLTVTWGRLGYLLSEYSFALAARTHIRLHRPELVFGRDERVLCQLRSLHVPLVWESHVGSCSSEALQVARAALRVVVLTQAARTFYIQKGIPGEKIVVAADAIDLADFSHAQSKDSARLRLGLPTDAFLALYVGSLGGWKGVDTLLAASRLLPAHLQVAIIGGLPAEVEKYRIKFPAVHFIGPRPYTELADNMAAADVLVLPNTSKDSISTTFTSPLKLFAYLMSGRPIVASDLPSLREVLSDDLATLVSADSPTALAAAIQEVFEKPAVALERATRARAHGSTYTWQNRVQLILGRSDV